MKKTVLMLLAIFFCTTMSAQLVTGTTYTKAKKKASALWLDLGVGKMKDIDGAGIDLGLRWNRNIYQNYLSWDIIKVKAETSTKYFSELITAQALTGLRGTSPVLFGNSSLFAAFGIGYGYCFGDASAGGLDWDVSVGINITPRIMVGVGYNDQSLSFDEGTGHMKYTSLRIGFNF